MDDVTDIRIRARLVELREQVQAGAVVHAKVLSPVRSKLLASRIALRISHLKLLALGTAVIVEATRRLP